MVVKNPFRGAYFSNRASGSTFSIGPEGGGMSQVSKNASPPPMARTNTTNMIRVKNPIRSAVNSTDVRRSLSNSPVCATAHLWLFCDSLIV
jgi:hypothetical protein